MLCNLKAGWRRREVEREGGRRSLISLPTGGFHSSLSLPKLTFSVRVRGSGILLIYLRTLVPNGVPVMVYHLDLLTDFTVSEVRTAQYFRIVYCFGRNVDNCRESRVPRAQCWWTLILDPLWKEEAEAERTTMTDNGRFLVINSSLSHLCFYNLCLPNPAPPQVAARLAKRVWMQELSAALHRSWGTTKSDLNKDFFHVTPVKLECRDGIWFDLAVFGAHCHIKCREGSRNCIRGGSGAIIGEPFGTIIKVWFIC